VLLQKFGNNLVTVLQFSLKLPDLLFVCVRLPFQVAPVRTPCEGTLCVLKKLLLPLVVGFVSKQNLALRQNLWVESDIKLTIGLRPSRLCPHINPQRRGEGLMWGRRRRGSPTPMQYTNDYQIRSFCTHLRSDPRNKNGKKTLKTQC